MKTTGMSVLTLVLSLLVGMAASSVVADDTKLGFSDESEAGVVMTGGNSQSRSYSFRQLNHYRWEHDTLRFDGKYLKTSSSGVESARFWLLGLRYERSLVGNLSGYVAQNVESDVYAGYLQRYNSDIGAKYYFIKSEDLSLLSEAGYRYAIENRSGGKLSQSLLRLFVEANKDWTKTFSTKAGIEYLPNLTISSDYQINLNLSASAALSEVFGLKTGYSVKYRKIPVAPATIDTDTQFTTAIVAKF